MDKADEAFIRALTSPKSKVEEAFFKGLGLIKGGETKTAGKVSRRLKIATRRIESKKSLIQEVTRERLSKKGADVIIRKFFGGG